MMWMFSLCPSNWHSLVFHTKGADKRQKAAAAILEASRGHVLLMQQISKMRANWTGHARVIPEQQCLDINGLDVDREGIGYVSSVLQ